MKSKGEYWLPVVIAGKQVTVRTDVVQSDYENRRGKIDLEKDI